MVGGEKRTRVADDARPRDFGLRKDVKEDEIPGESEAATTSDPDGDDVPV